MFKRWLLNYSIYLIRFYYILVSKNIHPIFMVFNYLDSNSFFLSINQNVELLNLLYHSYCIIIFFMETDSRGIIDPTFLVFQ
jgi:hypothetical protein